MCQNQLQFEVGFADVTAQQQVYLPDCHENGACEELCGSGYTACTYMDWGSGTQLCHKD